MARKFEPRRGCWKFVDIIDVSGADKESKDGLPVFGTSETKMNCGTWNQQRSRVRYRAVKILLNSLVREPHTACAFQFLGTT